MKNEEMVSGYNYIFTRENLTLCVLHTVYLPLYVGINKFLTPLRSSSGTTLTSSITIHK